MNKALLPAGFHDLLFPEAESQSLIVENLLHSFKSNGYSRVAPPVIEFEDSLFASAGHALENQTFRLMDPLSHGMMGVRSDMTVQIARIAESRLKSEPYPLRLSYAGDVFRVKGEGLYAERQFTQAGIELIGVDSIYADAEVVLLAAAALTNVGVNDICMDFTIPGLVEIILDGLELSYDGKNELLSAIKKKDAGLISALGGKSASLLNSLVDPSLDIGSLVKLKLPKAATALCRRLQEVVSLISKQNKDIHISVDPLEAVKFHYHSGIGFSIFAKGAKEELGRGGRYMACEKTGGIGVTLYVNELFRLLPEQKPGKKVFLPLGASLDVRNKLIDKGLVVINAIEKSKDYKSEALRLGCDYIFEGENLVNLF